MVRLKRVTLLAGTLFLASVLNARQAQPSPPSVTAGKTLKLSGVVQFLGKKQESGTDSLAVRRARFTLSVDLLKGLKGKFMIDAVRSPILVEAQLEYSFSKFAALRFGQFYVPFGFESTTSASDLDTINYAQSVEKLAPGRDLGTFGRDVGATLTGSYSIFDYSVGFFNGQGANKADTNEKKDFSGRLRLTPVKSLSFGASVYKGLYSAAAGTPAVVRDRFGLDASFALGEATLKGEYLRAVDGKTRKSGWFIRAGYFLVPKKIQVLGMWDSFDKNTDVSEDRVSVATAGVNWFFTDRTKIQLNYEFTRSESGVTVNKALLVQFQAAF